MKLIYPAEFTIRHHRILDVDLEFCFNAWGDIYADRRIIIESPARSAAQADAIEKYHIS